MGGSYDIFVFGEVLECEVVYILLSGKEDEDIIIFVENEECDGFMVIIVSDDIIN